MKFITIVLLSAISLLAQDQAAQPVVQPAKTDAAPYGFHAGTVGGSIEGGGMHETGAGGGLHPALKGGVEIGVHKYLAIFGEGGWSHASGNASSCYGYYCASASATLNYYQLGGGLEVVGTNHSRFVPYGKIGAAYVGAGARVNLSGVYSGSGSGYASAPAAVAGGGLRAYINHHVGIDTQVSFLRTLGNYGGSTIIAPTVGVFFQSK
jgi:hypothetical protein